ncbi:MAG: sensor histidine kinase N-terminal domain-containing protein [Algicola sp.]|nr:sensor histidine kinase N-terminal domain-containing protein [Algicola sp.]
MRSIRRSLVSVIIATMTLVSFYAALQGYRSSMKQVNQLFDAELQTYAASLKMAANQRGVLPMPDNTTVAFQVFKDNTLVFRSNNAPDQQITAFNQGFSDKNFARSRWRTFTQFHQPLGIWVVVAQRWDKRFELAEGITLASVYPTVLSLPLMAILIWLIVTQGLHSLKSIAKQLQHKKADDLEPVTINRIPLELKQIIETTNALFHRLDEAFSREKRFASDAAHELKTPLSVLKINAYNLSKAQTTHEDIALFDAGVERMSHVIDQILALYKTSPEQFDASLEPTDLYALCQNSIAQLYPQIDAKDQHIELHGQRSIINAQPFSIATLLQNLVSNASKYTPDQGEIHLTVEQNGEVVVLTVEDSGPGIPEQQHQRVLERFYRVGGDRHNSGIQGCGLGLSIVNQITRLHHGTLALSHSKFASGLKVTLTLPAPESHHA